MTSLISEIEKILLCKNRDFWRYTELFLAYMAGTQNPAVSALKVIQNILVLKCVKNQTYLLLWVPLWHILWLYLNVSLGQQYISLAKLFLAMQRDFVGIYLNLLHSVTNSFDLFFFLPRIICIPYMKCDTSGYGLPLVLCCCFLGVVHKTPWTCRVRPAFLVPIISVIVTHLG